MKLTSRLIYIKLKRLIVDINWLIIDNSEWRIIRINKKEKSELLALLEIEFGNNVYYAKERSNSLLISKKKLIEKLMDSPPFNSVISDVSFKKFIQINELGIYRFGSLEDLSSKEN